MGAQLLEQVAMVIERLDALGERLARLEARNGLDPRAAGARAVIDRESARRRRLAAREAWAAARVPDLEVSLVLHAIAEIERDNLDVTEEFVRRFVDAYERHLAGSSD